MKKPSQRGPFHGNNPGGHYYNEQQPAELAIPLLQYPVTLGHSNTFVPQLPRNLLVKLNSYYILKEIIYKIKSAVRVYIQASASFTIYNSPEINRHRGAFLVNTEASKSSR